MDGQLDLGEGGDEEADYIVGGGGGNPPLRHCPINRIKRNGLVTRRPLKSGITNRVSFEENGFRKES